VSFVVPWDSLGIGRGDGLATVGANGPRPRCRARQLRDKSSGLGALALPGRPMIVEVRSHNWSDVGIYVERLRSWHRLGPVTTMTTCRMEVPRSIKLEVENYLESTSYSVRGVLRDQPAALVRGHRRLGVDLNRWTPDLFGERSPPEYEEAYYRRAEVPSEPRRSTQTSL